MTAPQPASRSPLHGYPVLTQGDPAGIGPELTAAIWLARGHLDLQPFALVASASATRQRCAALGLNVPVVVISQPSEAGHVFGHGLPVIDHGLDAMTQAGTPLSATAAGTIRSIEMAVSFVQRREATAIVTNPIAKSVLYAVGFKHPGHTEFLAGLAALPGQRAPHPVMMIWSDALAVVPVTIHIPLREVPQRLTTALIVETGIIVDRDLKTRFGMTHPRIAVAGLNPHAGEGGALGHEDDVIVRPAVAALRQMGLSVSGPHPADTMFHARARSTYDVALTMYHDQGLIPVKTLAFDVGVNVTLGLPFIRTSPDHGTAFDIAGKGLARPDSLVAALNLAHRLAQHAVPA